MSVRLNLQICDVARGEGDVCQNLQNCDVVRGEGGGPCFGVSKRIFFAQKGQKNKIFACGGLASALYCTCLPGLKSYQNAQSTVYCRLVKFQRQTMRFDPSSAQLKLTPKNDVKLLFLKESAASLNTPHP